ncbi:MAG: AAA family ATPase [Bacillota bacterium]
MNVNPAPPERVTLFLPGQPLQMVSGNPLYRGLLESRVIAVNEHSLVITMPTQNGKTVFLPVGTVVEVHSGETDSGAAFQAEVLIRSLQPEPNLTITLPHAVSRGGRSEPVSGAAKVIAITSGKGGVGKTTLAINLGIALSRLRRRVCLIDVDLGTANVDFLLRLNAPYNISHLLTGEKNLAEISMEGPAKLRVIPGASGLADLANLSEWQFTRLIHAFNQLERESDIVLLDTGAGIAANVTHFLVAADEVLVVTTPDPHAVLDAYALIKTLCRLKEKPNLKLIVNRADSYEEESRVKRNILKACSSFLQQPLEYLGWVPESAHVAKSVREIMPFIIEYPKSEAAGCVVNIARKLAEQRPLPEQHQQSGLRRFIDELQNLFKNKL